METIPRGIRASVYCRLGRKPSSFNLIYQDQVTVVGPGIPELFPADERAPAVETVSRIIDGKEYIHLKPIVIKGTGGFGGSFVFCSDSRFPKARGTDFLLPLKLHDRLETQ